MSQNRFLKFTNILIGFIIIASVLPFTYVEASTQKGTVKVINSGTTEVVDPEDPDEGTEVDPGPSTKGDLRIDYVSPLDFGTVKIDSNKKTYNALASKIGKEGKARGSFIQISDFREKKTGWTLQVKQDHQFKTADSNELKGAVLSLDKGWANSINDENAPSVTRDTLSINNIGQLYDVARAEKDKGKGVWSINFGASKDNEDNQPVTLVTNNVSKKDISAAIRNSAVNITIPNPEIVEDKEYITKISWVLSETP